MTPEFVFIPVSKKRHPTSEHKAKPKPQIQRAILDVQITVSFMVLQYSLLICRICTL